MLRRLGTGQVEVPARLQIADAEIRSVLRVVVPCFARSQAVNAYGYLPHIGVHSWADFVLAICALQQAVLQQIAFILWWHCVGDGPLGEFGKTFERYLGHGRGFIVTKDNFWELYMLYANQLRLPVYAILSTDEWMIQ